MIHGICVFCMDVGTTANFALLTLKKIVFITEVESVYCEVRSEALYSTQKFRLGNVNENLECDMQK